MRTYFSGAQLRDHNFRNKKNSKKKVNFESVSSLYQQQNDENGFTLSKHTTNHFFFGAMLVYSKWDSFLYTVF